MRVAWEFALERCSKTSANRHSIMISVLAGCIVRLCYVDLVDIVPATPLELEFVLRSAKEILWFTSFAFMQVVVVLSLSLSLSLSEWCVCGGVASDSRPLTMCAVCPKLTRA